MKRMAILVLASDSRGNEARSPPGNRLLVGNPTDRFPRSCSITPLSARRSDIFSLQHTAMLVKEKSNEPYWPIWMQPNVTSRGHRPLTPLDCISSLLISRSYSQHLTHVLLHQPQRRWQSLTFVSLSLLSADHWLIPDSTQESHFCFTKITHYYCKCIKSVWHCSYTNLQVYVVQTLTFVGTIVYIYKIDKLKKIQFCCWTHSISIIATSIPNVLVLWKIKMILLLSQLNFDKGSFELLLFIIYVRLKNSSAILNCFLLWSSIQWNCQSQYWKQIVVWENRNKFELNFINQIDMKTIKFIF